MYDSLPLTTSLLWSDHHRGGKGSAVEKEAITSLFLKGMSMSANGYQLHAGRVAGKKQKARIPSASR